MKSSKIIRELTEQRDRALAKAMEGNRFVQIQIDGLYFCVEILAGDSCGGILARKVGEGLKQIGSFMLLHKCDGFYITEVLATLDDDSFLNRFSESNLNGLMNRLRLHLGMPETGPSRALCVVGGSYHYAVTEPNPTLM